MSGIEVAGIALAALPLLVAGLNQAVDGIETIDRWRRYKLKLKDYANILESAGVYLFDTLEELLGDIVESDVELELLLGTPGGSFWKEPAYEERLRRRLNRSYTSYLRTIDRLGRATEAVRKKLGIDDAGAVNWGDYSVVEREIKRIKLTLSKSVHKELLDEIWQANRELREVTQQNIAREKRKGKRRSKRPLAQLRLIRKYAVSLYQVLMTEKAWKCTCGVYHMASLRLEVRPQKIAELGTDEPPQYNFRVLLSAAERFSNASATTSWAEFEVFPSLESPAVASEFQQFPQTLCLQSPSTKRAVRFAPNDGYSPIEPSRDEASAEIDLNNKLDLCGILCAPEWTGEDFRCLIDVGNDKYQHKLHRADTVIGLDTFSRSLGDILKDSLKHGPDEGLSRKDRLQIAVTLASSVLQLDGTSWLKSQWSTNDIFFHHKNGQPESMKYSSPYLSWQRCCNTEAPSLEHLRLSNHMIRSNVLLALGLALVELCFGRTLEDMQKPEDVDTDASATRFKTAARLLGRVDQEMGGVYGDAVRKCLYQPFDVRELNFDLEEVQQRILDEIVSPLIDDFDKFNGKAESKW